MRDDGSLPRDFKRSGSQKRQRRKSLQISLTDEEAGQVYLKSRACGLSQASYGRACILGTPGPRAKRSPTINAEALGKATAALNKVGSNLNQIAHVLNAGGSSVTSQECFAALAETRVALSQIMASIRRKARD